MTADQGNRKAVVVDNDRATIALARSLLNTREFSVFVATDHFMAEFLLKNVEPELLIITHDPPDLNAPAMTRALRRGDLSSRKAPVVMLAREVSEGDLRRARDAGVDEVLSKPFAVKDLMLRIDTALKKRREWIEGIAYVGPDRRRFNSAEFSGRRRRRMDKDPGSPHEARVGQALKIMKAAIEAIDSEPRQALRALKAQADELQDAAVASTDFQLALAAKTLRTHLSTAVEKGHFSSKQMARDLDNLLAAQAEAAKLAG